MIGEPTLSFTHQARLQGRVIWALTMREVITRYGREGLGTIWLVAEPAMFIIGVMLIFSHMEANATYPVAAYLGISYPTILLWRNGTSRTSKCLEINRALLHHQPIRPIDIVYSRILLEFSGAAAAFILLYLAFVALGICTWPQDILKMTLGYILIGAFSFGFVLVMAALSELSDTFERVSHVLLYLMLPFCGVFAPLYAIPPTFREPLLYFPLVDAVEYFHSGYYGSRMPTFFHLPYTIFAITLLILFGQTLMSKAIARVKIT